MRGRKRIQPGHHAARGWFYPPIQKVIKKWDPIFGREVTNLTFHQVRRVMEFGRGELQVEIHGVEHRTFVCELMSALDRLHNPKNSYGWVVRIWPRLKDKPTPERLLMSYEEIQAEIQKFGGPKFSTTALKGAARRLRMLVSAEQRDIDEFMVHNPDLNSV